MRITLYYDNGKIEFAGQIDRYNDVFECFDYNEISEDVKLVPMLSDLWENDTWIRILNREIHNWLNSYGTTYSLHYTRILDEEKIASYLWEIDIENDNIAMLFKLTWC